MPKYQVQTDQGTYIVETDDAPAPAALPDAAAQMRASAARGAVQHMQLDNPYNFTNTSGGGFWDSAKEAFTGALSGLVHLPTAAEISPTGTADAMKDLPVATVGRVADQAGAGNLRGAAGTVAGTGAALAVPMLAGEAAGKIVPKIPGTVRAVGETLKPFKTQLDPAEASAVAYGQREGVQLPTSVLTGSKVARNTENILQNLPLAEGVAKAARATEQSTLAAAGTREVNKLDPGYDPNAPVATAPGPVPAPLDVGEAIHQTALDNEQAHNSAANDSYSLLRSIESQPEFKANLRTGTKRVESGIDNFGNPAYKNVPVMEDVQLPVDYRGLKAAVKPLLAETLRPMSIAQEQSSTGIKAMRNIMDAPDFVSASTADQDLGALKGIIRESPQSQSVGQAAFAAKQLSAAVDDAVARAGPDAVAALKAGRDATVAKYGAQDFQKQIGFKNVGTGSVEPGSAVELVNRLTAPMDRNISLLRSLQDNAPEHIPALAQAKVQGLIEKGSADAGMAKPQTALSDWNKQGAATKQILYGNRTQSLTDFFTLQKKMGENPNPSGSGSLVTMVQGALAVKSPMTAIPYVLGIRPLTRLLFNPGDSRLLITAMKTPAGGAGAALLARQLVSAAGGPEALVPATPAGVSTPAANAGTIAGDVAGGSGKTVSAGASAGRSAQTVLGTQGSGGGGIRSADTSIPVPGESGAGYPAQYKLRELADVNASHSGQTFLPNPKYALKNDRNYMNAVNQGKIIAGASRSEFNPALHINDNPDASNGPLITDAQGQVLGGNGRKMMLDRVYSGNPKGAADYRALLRSKAEQFGIDPGSIDGMKQPVLTREIPESEFRGPGAKQKAITDFNKKGTAALTPAEQAIADSHRVSPETLNDMAGRLEAKGPDASIADVLEGKAGGEVLQKLVGDGAVTPQEKAALVNSDGELTPAGKSRISQLMIARFFRDAGQLDTIAPSIRGRVERMAAPLAQVESKAGWNLTPHMQEALELLERARVAKIPNLDDFLRQDGLFGKQSYSDQAVTLARAIQGWKSQNLTKAVRGYAADASYAGKGDSLFGDTPTAGKSFADAFEQEPAPEEPPAKNALAPKTPRKKNQ